MSSVVTHVLASLNGSRGGAVEAKRRKGESKCVLHAGDVDDVSSQVGLLC